MSDATQYISVPLKATAHPESSILVIAAVRYGGGLRVFVDFQSLYLREKSYEKSTQSPSLRSLVRDLSRLGSGWYSWENLVLTAETCEWYC